MNELMLGNGSKEIKMNHVELCELINKLRAEEGNKKKLRPDSLLDKIRKEVNDMKELGLEISLQNFMESTYINSRGRKYPTYEMNRDGILQIASSESVYVRAKVLEYVNALEERIETLQISEYDNAILGIVHANSDIEQALAIKKFENVVTKPLLTKIEEDEPKVDYFEKFMSSNRLFTSTQVAKLYGLSSAQKLNKMLHDNGIIYRQGTSWLPYANVNDKWYKQIINEYGTQLKFTSKGVLEIAKVINIDINEDELEQEIDK